MWTSFKTMLSQVALDCFNSEIALLLRSLTTLVLPRRPNSDDVLHSPQPPLQALEWKRSLKLEAFREKRSTSSDDEPSRRTNNVGALSKPFSHKGRYQLGRHRAVDITTTDSTDNAARETTTNIVSLSTSSSELGASSGSLSTGSSSDEQTRAPSSGVRDVDDTTFVAATTPTSTVADPTSSPDGTTTGQSGTITSTSITSVLATSSSPDRPLPPSTTQPGSPAQSPASSVASSFTEREASVTSSVGSSTESSTSTSSATNTTSTTSTGTSSPAVSSSISAGEPTSTTLPSSTTADTTSTVSSSPGSVSSTSVGSTSVPISTTSIGSTIATGTSPSSPPTSPASISSTVSSGVSTTSPSTSRGSSFTTTRTTSTQIMSTTSSSRSSSSTLTSSWSSITSSRTTSAWTTTWTRQPVSKPLSTSSPSSSSRPNSVTSLSSSSFTRSISTSAISSANQIPLPSTSSSAISTRTTTVVVYTTHHSNGTTTTVETGTLRTSAPLVSAFAQNTGGIVGVAIASFIALLCLLFCLFFVCRRYRRRQNHYYDHSIEGIVALARSASRRPVDGDDDSYLEKSRSAPPSSTQGHGSANDIQDPFVIDGTTSQGEHLSSNHGSAESTNPAMVPMSFEFGGQSYLPGLNRNLSSGSTAMPPVFLADTPTRSSHDAWRAPAGSYPYVNTGGSRSAASLTVAGGSSTEDIFPSPSNTEESTRKYVLKRKSLSGPSPISYKTARRHKSTPPTAFMGVHQQPPFDFERQMQVPENYERSSVKSFISRLRNGRRTSTQSVATVRGPTLTSQGRESDESFMPSVTVFSPSLLNPPVIVTPPQPVLTFPRGITGNSYTPLGSQRSNNSSGDGGSSTVPWPPATLPTVIPPSPSPTDNSSGMMVEGLLHPRLTLQLAQSQQASMTSLRDHEDYSRPINGLVNNHLRSTTTFETHDSNELEQA